MRAASIILVAAALSLVGQRAEASLELARQRACTACHAPDKKLVGPAYRDVAKRYAGRRDALPLLVDSIRKGGAGKWGPVPMPAQPHLSDGDLKALAAWVLDGAR